MEDAPMSIEGLVLRFGRVLNLNRPTATIGSNGVVQRAFSKAGTVRLFLQPTGATELLQEGRYTTRTTVRAYASGSVDIRIDDELTDADTPTQRWRVSGSYNPAYLGTTLAAGNLDHTIVDLVEIEPVVSEVPA
jgi:hypothetical protein